MKKLRYWLGLPLYNAILWSAMMLIIVTAMLELELNDMIWDFLYRVFADDRVSLITALAVLFGIPFVTALWFPMADEDRAPVWKFWLLSFGAIFGVCFSTWMTLSLFAIIGSEDAVDAIGSALTFSLGVSFALALCEMAGYSLGLLVSKIFASVKERAADKEPLFTALPVNENDERG